MRYMIIFVLTALAWPTIADEAPTVCQDADGVIESIECYNKELKAADTELNAIWKRVIAEHHSGGVKEEHTKDIRAAQRAWITFRDADCEAKSKIGIPKYWELNRLSCLYQMTTSRTSDLKEAYLF
ncbi:MAG: lysozyme inhibitor LprI family protein [Pseudomonadota bacterium]